MWGCSQSKQEPVVQKIDSTADAIAAHERVLAAATADSVAKVAQATEAAKKAAEDKATEVAENIKKAYPYAYDLKPVDKEPETDMQSLKDAIEYPKAAKDKGIEGRVSVRALIGTNGRVIKSFTENSTNSLFDEPAQTAVKRAKFTSAILKGKHIQRWISVPVIYRLI
jgi:TonB family protein